ncbi:MAG: transcription antitermination factor NusB [Candidatus Gastranaerophilales bacterium]|nr:transcription antitermination factor NusB [Candidatus Gastranaerophilales bacterium]
MNARRASRELIIMVLSQIKLEKKDFDIDEILLNSVRTLVSNANDDLKTTTTSLINVKEYIQNLELNADVNKTRPIGVKNIAVQLPMTKDFEEKIDILLDVVEKCYQATEISELALLEEVNEVKSYARGIVELIRDNRQKIDDAISESAIGWDIKRMVAIDLSILRMAACELFFSKDVPVKVIVDEAVEIAKKYSTDESTSFIHGILGKIAEVNKIKK